MKTMNRSWDHWLDTFYLLAMMLSIMAICTAWKLLLQLAMHNGILKAKMCSLACEEWRRQQTSNQLWIKGQRSGVESCLNTFWCLSLLALACQSPWLHCQAPNSL
jgi:hypothetical protein